jgi:hypothetical protein
MAHKTFISYKYNEAQDIRDSIIRALGKDATYYEGETSDSPDMSDLKTSTIKKKLTDMMFGTSVLIVVISPNMKQSKWIDWEIEYCLQNNTRQDRTSQTNGVIAVIKKINNGYDWFVNHFNNCHNSPVINNKNEYLYPIIHENHFNSKPPQWHCDVCKTYDWLNGSYIEYVEEESFLLSPQKYIDNAYDKSENDASGYVLKKSR